VALIKPRANACPTSGLSSAKPSRAMALGATKHRFDLIARATQMSHSRCQRLRS
jgi:hypothetical protein